MKERPVIAITMGDPVGVGPEITLKALAQRSVYEGCRPLIVGDLAVMIATEDWLKTGLAIRAVDSPEAGVYELGGVDVIGLSDLYAAQLQYGYPTEETGRAMVAYVTRSVDWALRGVVHGMVTCPINKLALRMAGQDFEGHTELLAQRTKTSDYVMMLAGSRLRVALVTIHVPLAEVPAKLTSDAVFKTISLTHGALTGSFGIPDPGLAVAGLNPHAGEGGLFGSEEIRVITPAVQRACEAGINVSGPYPPDTLFYRALDGQWDAVVCMYHDQGLIPFKMVHFSDGVNVTLGLPIVRTSVDHGTAYDIAGTGKADPGSLMAAIRMAAEHAVRRAKGQRRQ